MEEVYQITSALKHLSWGKHVAVLTDARFSGASTGACIGHIAPEALAGGPIGKVFDGDLIQIAVDRNRLEGSIDLVGHDATRFGPEEGTRSSRSAAARGEAASTTSMRSSRRSPRRGDRGRLRALMVLHCLLSPS